MSNGFSNNWAYIKTELNWLERVLMVAVSRQRRERQHLEQVSQSAADRVSAHWWKGLISLDSKAFYDEHRPKAAPKTGYRQQIQSRIEASDKSGVLLALPYLCRQLQLTPFEKNLLLMGIAPEVNRRYSRLYHYLQDHTDSELPTLELALRLLCRNDSDWQAARRRLSEEYPLQQQGLIRLIPSGRGTWLTASVQVQPPLVDLLLAEKPDRRALEALIFRAPANRSAMSSAPQPITWDDLVLPESLLVSLRQISDRLMAQTQIDTQWGFNASYGGERQGELQLFVGQAGTGKTLATQAMATALGTVPQLCDPQQLSPNTWEATVAALITDCPKVLMIKSPQLWFGADGSIAGAAELIAQRRQRSVLTVLSAPTLTTITPQWRQMMTVQPFPPPSEAERLQLWKRAFPPQAALGRLRWRDLATLALTGKEIGAIARSAALLAMAESSERIMQRHLSAALHHQGYKLPRKA